MRELAGVGGQGKPSMWDILQFMAQPSGVGRDAFAEFERDQGIGGTGTFAKSVTDRAPASMIDFFVNREQLAAEGQPPGPPGPMTQRAFDRVAGSPGQPSSAEPSSFLEAAASSSPDPGGIMAILQRMFPRADRVVRGSMAGERPGVMDVAGGLADVLPGPSEMRGAGAAIRHAGAPLARGVANAVGPHVPSFLAEAAGVAVPALKEAAPYLGMAAGVAGMGAGGRVARREMDEVRGANIDRAARPLDRDGVTDFDMMNPNWVHPKYRKAKRSVRVEPWPQGPDWDAMPPGVSPLPDRGLPYPGPRY